MGYKLSTKKNDIGAYKFDRGNKSLIE
jgi:hypothetical protein